MWITRSKGNENDLNLIVIVKISVWLAYKNYTELISLILLPSYRHQILLVLILWPPVTAAWTTAMSALVIAAWINLMILISVYNHKYSKSTEKMKAKRQSECEHWSSKSTKKIQETTGLHSRESRSYWHWLITRRQTEGEECKVDPDISLYPH